MAVAVKVGLVMLKMAVAWPWALVVAVMVVWLSLKVIVWLASGCQGAGMSHSWAMRVTCSAMRSVWVDVEVEAGGTGEDGDWDAAAAATVVFVGDGEGGGVDAWEGKGVGDVAGGVVTGVYLGCLSVAVVPVALE